MTCFFLSSKLKIQLEYRVIVHHIIYILGIFDVHVSNLCSPDASRATRVVDHEHVSALTASYQDQGCGQLVILVGMVTEDVDASSLEEPGCGCKVEILGMN